MIQAAEQLTDVNVIVIEPIPGLPSIEKIEGINSEQKRIIAAEVYRMYLSNIYIHLSTEALQYTLIEIIGQEVFERLYISTLAICNTLDPTSEVYRLIESIQLQITEIDSGKVYGIAIRPNTEDMISVVN